MNILFFSRLFYPHIGGVEKHVLEVSKTLIKKGYKIVVLTEQYDQKLKLLDNINTIEVYRIPVGKDDWFKKFRIWRQLWTYRKLIKKADIIHCHDVFFWYLPFRFLYLTKKVFTTFHGYETKFPPSKKAILIRKISEKLSWGNICVGDYIKKWYGTTPTFITDGGVGIHNYHTTVRGSYARIIRILFIGRLEEDTGILIYLKSLEILNKKKIEFEFEACGDGSLREEAKRYGKVYRFVKGLDQYIQKADIVFASSYLIMLEALVQSKIVIAIYENSLKEDYLKNSPFVDFILICKNAQEIASVIEALRKNPRKYETLIKNGFAWAKIQTWENCTNIYLKMWSL